MSTGLDFTPGDATPLVVKGTSTWTRGDAAISSNRIRAELARRDIQRAIIATDDPRLILVAIDATARAGTDLYVAHASIADGALAEIIEAHAIEARLGEDATWFVRSSPAKAATGNVFMMTSGTTGRPKIATHTLSTLCSRARASAGSGSGTGGRWLLTYQPTGFAGVQVILTAALTGGLIVVPDSRTPGDLLVAARAWGVDQLSGTPTFWRSLLLLKDAHDLSLRQATLGGEAADQTTLDRIRSAFPDARVTHTYASTEAGVVHAVHDALEGFPRAWLDDSTRRVQLRIRDGFLQVKSPDAMQGYRSSHEDQPIEADGWLATKDRAEIIGNRVKITGRDDSTINVGGAKVHPLTVENFLLRQHGVQDARVFGAPNPISGYLVNAEVVLSSAEDKALAKKRLLGACREGLESYQVPRALKIVDMVATRESGKKG